MKSLTLLATLHVVMIARTAMAVPTTLPETQPDNRAVHQVATVEEFVKAIGPDRIVELQSGSYDLSKVSRGKAQWYSWREAIDGQYELAIRNAANLEIRGVGTAEKPSHIVTPHPYAFVMSFEQCPSLRLVNLKLGHSPDAGFCSGGVVSLGKCKNAAISKCILYGCGTEGLNVKESAGFRMTDSVIEDCTNGILTAENCDNARFERCIFRRNSEYHGFDFVDCNGPLFTDCQITANILGGLDYPLFNTNLNDDAGRIRFVGGSIVGNSATALVNTEGMAALEKAKYEDNAWQAPEDVKKLRGTKTPRAEGGWTYVVPVGTASFWNISVAVYGDGKKSELLKKANPTLPKIIPPDTKVICPAADDQ